MKISIYPKSSDRKKSVPLLFSITGLTGSNIILSTFESLTLKDWEKIKNNKNHALNKRLDIKARAIENIVNSLIENESLSSANLKDKYNERFKPKAKMEKEQPEVVPITTIPTIRQVCEMAIKTYSKTQSKSHIRKFKTLLFDLDKFKPNASFEDLTPIFWEEFYKFLVTKQTREGRVGLSNNSIKSTHLKMLRLACKHAIRLGLKVSSAYLDFKTKGVETEKIVLTWAEVQQIEKCTLYLDIQQKVRDLYVFSCYTGLRHQDLSLKKLNFQFDGEKVFLSIITKKTVKALRILLPIQALSIAKKYDFELPVVSNQKCNHHLKLIAKHAKLNRLVQHTIYKGSERIVEIKEVHNYVSMHQARHNFSIQFLKLNSKKHGLKAMMTLQQILTHSSIKTTEIYGRMLEGDQDHLISAFDN